MAPKAGSISPLGMQAKASGVYSGGSSGTSGYRIQRPSLSEKIYMSSLALCVKHNRKNSEVVFDVLKNRHKPLIGEISLKEAVDIIAIMLSRVKLQDSNEMFQKGIELRLKEVISKVLFEDDCIPSQKAIKDYLEGGE
jgi:hypothetical protein